MIAPGGITPFWIGSGQLYSTAVQEAIDQYTGLSAKDLAFINTLITLEGSNYGTFDELFPFILGSNVEANGSIGLKGTTGTPVEEPTFDIGGLLFDGVDQYFDTTIIPSSGLTQASLDDIDIQCYLESYTNEAVDTGLFGCLNGSTRLFLQKLNSSSTLRAFLNATTSVNLAENFISGTLYGTTRDTTTNIEIQKDGAIVSSTSITSISLPDVSFLVGAFNNNGTPDNFITGKISTFKIGAAIGFSQSIHNTAVRTALTAYGSI